MVSPDQQFLCNGQVTEWRYQGKNSNAFQAIVWRPVQDSPTEFQIVGINNIPAGAVDTPVSYAVPENERITVKSGDVIGWSFSEPVLTYGIGESIRVRYKGKSLQTPLTVDGTFNINGVANRDYSIAAVVCDVCRPGKKVSFNQVN